MSAFKITTRVTFEDAKSAVSHSMRRISRQTTVKGLFAEIRALANYMIQLEKRSPIVAEWHYDDVMAMDTSSHPQLEKMKRAVLSEMLAKADAASPSYYTASPVGKPFQRRVEAASPVLDKFMWVASRLSRKNAIKVYNF